LTLSRRQGFYTGGLLVRDGARGEVRIPLERIAAVRHDLRFTRDGAAETAEFRVGGQTSVTVELREAVVAERLLGPVSVRTVRFHADDARGAVAAVREAVEALGGAGEGAVRPG
jgi:hypothetical protein